MGYNPGMADRAFTPDAMRQWASAQYARGVGHAAMRQALLAAGWQPEQADAALAAALDTPADGACAAPRSLPGPDLSAATPTLEADGHAVQLLAAMERPTLAVFAQLLDARECAALVQAARPRLARSLTVETQTGGEAVNADRTSEGMFFERGESALVRRIEARIAALLHWPVDHGEGLQVLRYGPGAEYKPHYDYFDPHEAGTPAMLRRGGQRIATLVMYLNDVDAGGQTRFPDIGLEVMPQRGSAVYFEYFNQAGEVDPRCLHAGMPVLRGEKWIATKWMRAHPYHR